jgi:hypothetical protein
MTDESCVFGKAVDAVYAQLGLLTGSLVAACTQDSPTLRATVANMVADAAVEAIAKFRADNPNSFDA